MKKQKRSNNKGFSLVELIVVIAIMAVLVGVLAPTLIKNIEKSRESKDLQNLDTVRQAVVTSLANEAAYNEAVPASGSTTTLTLASGSSQVTGAFVSNGGSSFNAEFGSILGKVSLSSKVCKDKAITIEITPNGKVTVSVMESGAAITGTYVGTFKVE